MTYLKELKQDINYAKRWNTLGHLQFIIIIIFQSFIVIIHRFIVIAIIIINSRLYAF